mgnify:CR=1 FL=1
MVQAYFGRTGRKALDSSSRLSTEVTRTALISIPPKIEGDHKDIDIDDDATH